MHRWMIPERVPIFDVCLNSLNPAHAGHFVTSTAFAVIALRATSDVPT